MRVPVYQQQVTTAALPSGAQGIRTSPEDFGAAIGRGLGDLGQVVNQIRNDSNRIRVDDADNQTAAASQAALQQARKLQGKNAFSAPDTVLPEFDKQVDAIAADLNPEQAFEYKRRASARRNELNAAIQSHMDQQARAYDDETFQGTLATGQDSIGMNYTDEGKVNVEIDRQDEAITSYAARNGLPPEWVQAKRIDMLSKSHATVIGQHLAAGNDLAADKWFQRYGAEISPEVKQAISRSMEVASTRGESMRESNRIFSQTKPLEDMLNEARQIQDPKIQDATVERITRLHGLYTEAKAETYRKNYQNAYDIVAAPDNLVGVDAVPPGMLSALRPEDRNALNSYAAKRLKGEEPTTDWGEYYKLQSLASSPATRDAFIKTNLLSYRNVLSDAEFKEVTKLQADLRAKSGSQEESSRITNGITTREDIVNETLAGLKLDPRPYTTSGGKVTVNEPAVAFRRLMDRAIIAHQQATGKPATPDDVRKFADQLVAQQSVQDPRGWYNPARWVGDAATTKQVPSFQLPGADRLAFAVSQVPEAEAVKIREAGTRAGKSLSDEQVMSIYNASLRNQPNAQ